MRAGFFSDLQMPHLKGKNFQRQGVAGTFFPRVHLQKKAADQNGGPKKTLPFPVRLVSFWHPLGGRKRRTFSRPFSYLFWAGKIGFKHWMPAKSYARFT